MRNLAAAFLIVTCIPSLALASQHPYTDVIGIYFEEYGSPNEIDVMVDVPFFAYLVINSPSGPNVSGVEFGYRFEVPEGLEESFLILDQGIEQPHVMIPSCQDTLLNFDCSMAVAFYNPLPAADITIVYSWQFMLLEPLRVQFYLTPCEHGQLLYDSDDGLIFLENIHHDSRIPVAMINGLPTPVRSESFGTLKALYR